jgi:hypothetical protein
LIASSSSPNSWILLGDGIRRLQCSFFTLQTSLIIKKKKKTYLKPSPKKILLKLEIMKALAKTNIVKERLVVQY